MSEPHPGIAPPGPGESLTYHKYYQWVIFFFFVQGVMFYLPRLFWKHSEGGLMKSLVGGLTDPLIPYQVNNYVLIASIFLVKVPTLRISFPLALILLRYI